MDDNRVSFHGRVDDELVAGLAVTREDGREVAAREPAAVAHADVGEAAIVIHRRRDQPRRLALLVRVVVTVVVVTTGNKPGIKGRHRCVGFLFLLGAELGIGRIDKADLVLDARGLGIIQCAPARGHNLQFEDVGMCRRTHQQIGVDVDILRLQVEHVLTATDLPAAAEATAVIQYLLMRTQFDLGGDAQAGSHLVDAIRRVLVVLDDLRRCRRDSAYTQQQCQPRAQQRLQRTTHRSTPPCAGT
ncbi:hypothetical protein D3C72_1412540 [compost metagenome]